MLIPTPRLGAVALEPSSAAESVSSQTIDNKANVSMTPK